MPLDKYDQSIEMALAINAKREYIAEQTRELEEMKERFISLFSKSPKIPSKADLHSDKLVKVRKRPRGKLKKKTTKVVLFTRDEAKDGILKKLKPSLYSRDIPKVSFTDLFSVLKIKGCSGSTFEKALRSLSAEGKIVREPGKFGRYSVVRPSRSRIPVNSKKLGKQLKLIMESVKFVSRPMTKDELNTLPSIDKHNLGSNLKGLVARGLLKYDDGGYVPASINGVH